MKFDSTILASLCLLAQSGALLAATEETSKVRGVKVHQPRKMMRGSSSKSSKKGSKKGGGSPDTMTFMGNVKVTNLAPEYGTCQTPVWVGIHDGTFNIYDRNVAASSELEAIAEDGNAMPLIDAFNSADGTIWDDTVLGPNMMAPVLCSGQSGTVDFAIEVTRGTPLYFSYATMVLPSNDAFLANGNPRAFRVFNGDSMPSLVNFTDIGSDVLDAGTEVNDEIPANTAFFGQTTRNTGIPENGVVTTHEGFRAVGMGGILDDERFRNADFTVEGYELIRVEVSFEEYEPY